MNVYERIEVIKDDEEPKNDGENWNVFGVYAIKKEMMENALVFSL